MLVHLVLLMADIPSLKLAVDKLDIDNLKSVLTDLIKFCNVVDNDVVKKSVYAELVKKNQCY